VTRYILKCLSSTRKNSASLNQNQTYGHATLPDNKVETDTLFDLGSAAKTTTAAAVALLVHDDRYPEVQWTTPVSKLLPEDFVLPDPRLTEEVTVEDILSHRSGLAYHDESYLSVRAENPDNVKTLTRNLRNLEFVKPLRTGFNYSNIMYSVATHLVETISGVPYVEYLRSRLWDPLEMTNTFHDLPDIDAHKAMDRKATGYYWDKKTKSYVAMPSYPQPEGQGAGCIFSSAGDYAKWIRALIKHGPPLSEAAYKDLITPRNLCNIEEEDEIPLGSFPLYALGLKTESYRGRTLISHNGAVPGFRATVAYMPEFDWGIVIIGNSDSAGCAKDVLKWTLIDEVLDVPKKERVDWSCFFRNLQERDDEADDEERPELAKPKHPKPLGLGLEDLVGTYHNAGYKGLALDMKDGKLMADCNDRCFPFMLTFHHQTGPKFVVEMRGVWDDYTRKLRGEFQIEDGNAVAMGVELEPDVKGGLIWFDKM
jgi:CubicO group peptidase (beta-lactamase class C family)